MLSALSVLLQSEVSKPKVAHLRAVNALIARAIKYREGVGLYFPVLKPPLKILCVHDARHVTKTSSYAQEGVLALLMEDRGPRVSPGVTKLRDDQLALLSGPAHVLANTARKAKRVSYSTSHGEALAGAAGKELAQSLVMRITEVLCGKALSLQEAIRIQEDGLYSIPIDHMTDCGDLFDLVNGQKPLAQDRLHRMYIMSQREDRLIAKTRYWLQIPTQWMVADALTKPMVSTQLYDLLCTGYVSFGHLPTHPIKVSYVKPKHEFDEKDGEDIGLMLTS